MTTFKSQRSTKTVDIRKAYTGTGIVVAWEGSSINLHPSNAPAIALAVLEAGGVVPFDDDEDWVTSEESQLKRVASELVRYANAKAESAAESAARDKRRDELAAEYFEGAYYHLKRTGHRRAIDRIIDTENEPAKERDAK